MHEGIQTIAGLQTIVVAPQSPSTMNIVMLHGYTMRPEDLAPFAHSLKIPATFYLPRAPLAASSGFTWWTTCEATRLSALKQGPRDLSMLVPVDRDAARNSLINFCAQVCATSEPLPLVVCGFSQGGMLACDAVLCGGLDVAGLALLSASRIAIDDWLLNSQRLRELRVLISHGVHDENLSFAAGEALRDLHVGSGAHVTWVPFDGGHEIPLLVWRNLRAFLTTIAERTGH